MIICSLSRTATILVCVPSHLASNKLIERVTHFTTHGHAHDPPKLALRVFCHWNKRITNVEKSLVNALKL
jgi:hypothetical protein